MTTTREKAEAILQDFLPRLEGLKDEALAAIEEVRNDANEKMRRHEQAREELEGVEARLMMLEAEKESLPTEHSRAVIADDVDEELRVKERFSTVAEEIEGLEAQRSSLREEIQRLLPRPHGHRFDAEIERTSQVATAAFREREALEHLQKKLTEALDAAVEPVATKHNALRALTETRSRERSWEEGAEQRSRVGA